MEGGSCEIYHRCNKLLWFFFCRAKACNACLGGMPMQSLQGAWKVWVALFNCSNCKLDSSRLLFSASLII
ncbi:hypothetical protein SKAU_G00310620 [Synaphobranchus kaupii]|uniref:Uncharacterized protein n=1 Tax=Synaphobranchus kaupii TaxID=118154 RepID=A0A9Q1ERK7_SYNKA|nr:hypothetical protein SKAU_G00310620 [Synaphobranchus kaupii]